MVAEGGRLGGRAMRRANLPLVRARMGLRSQCPDGLPRAARGRRRRVPRLPPSRRMARAGGDRKRAAYRDEDYWGRPCPASVIRRTRMRRRRARPGRPRGESHRPSVHGRPIGRVALRGPVAGRVMPTSRERHRRRRPAAHRLPTSPPRCGARRRPTSRRRPSATGAARSSSASWRCSTGPGSSSCSASSATRCVRTSACGPAAFGHGVEVAVRGRTAHDALLVPRQPAEHLHRQAHRTCSTRCSVEPASWRASLR